jgi:hypothetical protein
MKPKVKITLPPNYQRIPLPHFTEWVAALRSGKYAQGTDKLCKDNAYCCLGVLCEIQGRPKQLHPTEVNVLMFDDGWNYLTRLNPVYSVLAEKGFFPIEATITYQGDFSTSVHCLAALNDFLIPFDQIADVIEAIWCPESATK